MRIIIIAIVALLSLAGVSQAQVAAPRINPAAFVAGSIFNPAVLPWGGPSRVGGGIIDVDVEDTSGGATTPLADGDGIFAQVRLVGDNLAFHADMLDVSLDVEPAAGGGTVEFEESFIGIAYQWGDSFSIGVGVASGEDNIQGNIEESSLPLLGATLRLGDNMLVGGAAGTETVTEGPVDVERSVVMVGAALHSRDNMGGYHLEAYLDNRDSEENVGGGVTVDKEESVGLTAEVIFAENFLIGFELINTDITDPTDPTGANDLEVEETTVSLGWVKGQGLSFVVSSSTEEETDNAGNVTEFSSLLLAVAYSF